MASRKRTQQKPTSDDPVTAWAEDVVSGKVIAGPHIRNACRRHLLDLAEGPKRGLVWDLEAAKRAIKFFPDVLRLKDGQFDGLPFHLHPSQAFKVGSLFGWKRKDGTRRFRRAYIEEGKGNGKSPLAAGIGIYGMMADSEPGAQIYAAAARKEQAQVLFQDAVNMVDRSPPLKKRITTSGVNPVWNLADLKTGSFFKPISREAGRSGSGPRPHFALCDEVHEHPDRTVMEMLERGFKFRRQPLLLMITNSGSDRNSVCWEEHEHAVRVAAGTQTPDDDFTFVGEIIDDTTFSFVCSLDKDDDPLEDPSCWVKANPLLGVILQPQYLADVVAQAKSMPGKLNGILRLHFCKWTDSETAWMPRPTLEAVLADFDPAEHAGKEVCAGIDLGSTQDMTAMAFMVQTGTVERERPDGSVAVLPTYDAWVEAWVPKEGIAERAKRDKAPYDVWEKQGWLTATEGKRVRFDFVASRLAEVASEYDVAAVAYDRHTFRKFEDECEALGLEVNFVEHPQGGKRRARPPEEVIEAAKRDGKEPPQGLWMPGSILELETLILEGRIRLRKSPVLISALMSVAFDKDPLDNRWFVKAKATQRIDCAVALAMAVGAATANVKAPSMDLDTWIASYA